MKIEYDRLALYEEYPMNYYIMQADWIPVKGRKPCMAKFSGPGPATVGCCPLTGFDDHCCTFERAPMYSFGLALPTKNTTIGPGPGRYLVKGLNRYGQYFSQMPIILPRRCLDKIRDRPSPASYRREDCDHLIFPVEPSWIMGLTLPFKGQFQSPGPAAYMIPCTFAVPKVIQGWLETPPQWTHVWKGSNYFELQFYKRSPGPAVYMLPKLDIYLNRKPEWVIGIKIKELVSFLKPGPGAHSPEKHWFTKKSVPRHTFGIKHNECTGFFMTGSSPNNTICCRPC